jgi:hypothetical protein
MVAVLTECNRFAILFQKLPSDQFTIHFQKLHLVINLLYLFRNSTYRPSRITVGTSHRVQPGENRQGRRAEVITTITQRMKHPIAKIRKTQSQSSGKHQVAAIRGFYCARDLNKTPRQQKFLSTVHAERNYPARKGNLTPPPSLRCTTAAEKSGARQVPYG